MGEAYLRVFYARNAGDKAAVHFVSRHRSFLPVKPFVAAAYSPDKSHAHQTGRYRDMGLLQEKLQLLGHIPPQRLTLMTIEDAN